MKNILDLITFWQKKRNPAASSAQHLAKLIGSSEGNFSLQAMEGEPNSIDLNTELFSRSNIAIAKLVVIAGLLENNDLQRGKILRLIKPERLGENTFEGYLFRHIRESLQATGSVSPSQVGQQVYKFRPQVDGQASSKGSLDENIFNWVLILGFEPTPSQVDKAIELISSNVNVEE